MKTVLGLETSCDDTSVALVRGHPGPGPTGPTLLGLKTYSQEEDLAPWGGVVPEIACRHHVGRLVPLLRDILAEEGLTPRDLDAVATTVMPGLVGPLLTGLSAAKTLSLLFHLPVIGINHLFAHLEAIHLTRSTPYPYLGLVASGGHGFYALVHRPNRLQLLGRTRDDAPGEAFDKGGKLLGLPHPGGRHVDACARRSQNPKAYSFPVGLASSRDATLSFSGVKTALRVFVDTHGPPGPEALPDVCYAYQDAIVRALVLKAHFAYKRALTLTGLDRLPFVVGGGVASNSHLRSSLKEHFPDLRLVPPRFCTDNGAMIATLGLRSFDRALPFPDSLDLEVKGTFP